MSWLAFFGLSLPAFLLVLGRTSGLLLSAPYFQSRSLPPTIRAAIALLLAMVLTPVLKINPGDWSHGNLWMISIAGEVITGLTMGYLLNLTFAGIQLAGQLIEVPMGFGVVNIIDPQSGGEIPIVGQFQQIFVLWLFLLFQGDHLIIKALIQSYDLIPPAGFAITSLGVKAVVQAFSGMFLLGLEIALPVMGVLFLADLMLGIISRLIPQINVFVTGMPIKIVLGMMLLVLILPTLLRLMANLATPGGDLWQNLWQVMSLMKS